MNFMRYAFQISCNIWFSLFRTSVILRSCVLHMSICWLLPSINIIVINENAERASVWHSKEGEEAEGREKVKSKAILEFLFFVKISSCEILCSSGFMSLVGAKIAHTGDLQCIEQNSRYSGIWRKISWNPLSVVFFFLLFSLPLCSSLLFSQLLIVYRKRWDGNI